MNARTRVQVAEAFCARLNEVAHTMAELTEADAHRDRVDSIRFYSSDGSEWSISSDDGGLIVEKL